MKVKVIKDFLDKNEKKIRKEGEIFEVTKERKIELENHVYGPFIEEIKGGKLNAKDSKFNK